MRYHVDWNKDAEADLARIWTEAGDRRAVSEAADRLESALKANAATLGESRNDAIRIAFDSPLAIEFEANEQAGIVLVIAVWTIRNDRRSD